MQGETAAQTPRLFKCGIISQALLKCTCAEISNGVPALVDLNMCNMPIWWAGTYTVLL
jgi:hypothetical protein